MYRLVSLSQYVTVPLLVMQHIDISREDDIRMYVDYCGLSKGMAKKQSDVVKALGAAYGTAKSGIGIAGVGTFRPDLIMKARPPAVKEARSSLTDTRHNTVTYPSGHVWNYCGLRSRYRRAHRR